MEIGAKALIDTGAPRTVVPRGVGDALAVAFPHSWDPGLKKIYLLGRSWSAVTVEIQMTLPPFDDLAWHAEVDFVLEEGLRIGLLGYGGFLNRWAVSFNAYDGYFVVEEVESFSPANPTRPVGGVPATLA